MTFLSFVTTSDWWLDRFVSNIVSNWQKQEYHESNTKQEGDTLTPPLPTPQVELGSSRSVTQMTQERADVTQILSWSNGFM